MRPRTVWGRLRAVRLLGLDVDGVLTDGKLHYGPKGVVMKSFHVQDGLGIRRLQESGILVAALSGRRDDSARARLDELGLAHVCLGEREKTRAWQDILGAAGVLPEEAAFLGDDLPDAEIFGFCGVAIAVANAMPLVRRLAHHVTKKRGGEGAVREVAELLLMARG